ncbi:MAG: SurA N-terminal domain-containing protein [Deltaproteobacteria bacterium]|nr:SurA N-terminal domain-containing protein [Deltaproteobacteria bacterium]
MKACCIILCMVLAANILWFLSGCSCSDNALQIESTDEYLIKVNDRVINVRDFNSDFEMIESLYPYNSMQTPAILNDAKIMFLNQLIEEMVLAERAEELNINITDNDVEKVVSDIKKDYPDDEFKKKIFENAVPYNFWRNGIRKRLIMERVIEKDLGERIAIIPEDIIKYYEGYNEGRNENSDSTIGPDDINKKIIKHLRREKSEKMYGPWLGDLKKKYNIKVNMTEWNKIIKGRFN